MFTLLLCVFSWHFWRNANSITHTCLHLFSLSCVPSWRVRLHVTCASHFLHGLGTFTCTHGSLFKKSLFYCIFFLLCCIACRILVLWPGVSLSPLQWKHRVVTTGPAEKFLGVTLQFTYPLMFFLVKRIHNLMSLLLSGISSFAIIL